MRAVRLQCPSLDGDHHHDIEHGAQDGEGEVHRGEQAARGHGVQVEQPGEVHVTRVTSEAAVTCHVSRWAGD